MREMQQPVSPLALPAYLASATGLQSRIMLETAELALRRFIRSRWLLLTLFLALVLFLVCFRYPFGASYFYDIATFGLGAITATTAYVLVRWVVPPIHYIRYGRRTSTESVFAGLVLAMAAISASLILLVLLLALITGRFVDTGPGPLVAGAIGLLANCILVGTLTMTLSSPATTAAMRRIFLVWLVLAFASYQADGIFAVLLFPARLPLLPVAACYDFGNSGSIGWGGLLALLFQAGLVAGLVWFHEASLRHHWLSARHLRAMRATWIGSAHLRRPSYK
jgi:hypothetical protein